jgi:hypothetical protein
LLLSWPPSKRQLLFVLAVNAFLVVGLVAAGAPLFAVVEGTSVESVSLTARLNDADGYPDLGNDTAYACTSTGTPPDTVSVIGGVTVDVAGERTVALSVPASGNRTTMDVEGSDGRADVFWLFDDDETLAVGEAATFRVRVLDDGTPVANATRNVTVEEGTYELSDCEPA